MARLPTAYSLPNSAQAGAWPQPRPQLSAPVERRAHKTKMTALRSGRVLGLAPHQRERDHGDP